MGTGPVPPLPPIEASEAMLGAARINCASRCRERGQAALAVSYEHGEQDAGWAMRHEVSRLKTEESKS